MGRKEGQEDIRKEVCDGNVGGCQEEGVRSGGGLCWSQK